MIIMSILPSYKLNLQSVPLCRCQHFINTTHPRKSLTLVGKLPYSRQTCPAGPGFPSSSFNNLPSRLRYRLAKTLLIQTHATAHHVVSKNHPLQPGPMRSIKSSLTVHTRTLPRTPPKTQILILHRIPLQLIRFQPPLRPKLFRFQPKYISIQSQHFAVHSNRIPLRNKIPINLNPTFRNIPWDRDRDVRPHS